MRSKSRKAPGMGAHVNVIMQTCFFAISGVLPREQAIEEIKKAIKKTYGRKGEEVVKKNFNAVDQSVANLHQVNVPDAVTSKKSPSGNGGGRRAGVCPGIHRKDNARRRRRPAGICNAG